MGRKSNDLEPDWPVCVKTRPTRRNKEDILVTNLVPGNKVGLVIGKGGHTIQKLEEQTETQMYFVSQKRREQGMLKIQGEKGAVEKAKQEVLGVVKKKVKNKVKKLEEVTICVSLKERKDEAKFEVREMVVPRDKVGSVIGRAGATIQRLQEQSGAKMDFINLERGKEGVLKIKGIKEAVEKARQEVEVILDLKEMKSIAGKLDGCFEENMVVPNDKIGQVIGKHGANIQRLQEQTGARMQLNGERGKEGLLKIQGLKEAVEQARHAVQVILDMKMRKKKEPDVVVVVDASGVLRSVEEELLVPDDEARNFIGKGINIMTKTGAKLEWVGEVLKIQGSKMAVESALEKVRGKIKGYMEVLVPADQVKKDVGKGRGVMKKTGAKLEWSGVDWKPQGWQNIFVKIIESQ